MHKEVASGRRQLLKLMPTVEEEPCLNSKNRPLQLLAPPCEDREASRTTEESCGGSFRTNLEAFFQRLVCAKLNSKYQLVNLTLALPSVPLYYTYTTSLIADEMQS